MTEQPSAPTVTIAIPAHNEEANIRAIIESMSKQRQTRFTVKEILIISDGSTDDTVNIVESLGLSLIKLIKHEKSKGKSSRMVEIFQNIDTDILVLADADTQPIGKDVVARLVEPIITGRATLTSGSPKQKIGKGFVDFGLQASGRLQEYIKLNFSDSKSIYACHGRLVALHKSVYKHKELRPLRTGNDAFLFLFNKQNGNGFEYVKDAKVWFKMPQNFSDFAKQRKRYVNTIDSLVGHFGEGVRDEYVIPLKLKIKAIVNTFTNVPLSFLAYLTLVVYSFFKRERVSSNGWEVSESTKSLD